MQVIAGKVEHRQLRQRAAQLHHKGPCVDEIGCEVQFLQLWKGGCQLCRGLL